MKIKKILTTILATTLALCIFASCGAPTMTSKGKRTNAFFKTQTDVLVYDDFTQKGGVENFEKMWEECKILLSSIDESLSVAIETSDIARFNEAKFGEQIEINSITASTIKLAKEAYQKSEGLFDPTVYPLVDLWGFTPRFNELNFEKIYPYDRDFVIGERLLPDEKYIQAFKKLVGFDGIELIEEGGAYYLKKSIPPVTVDGVSYEAKIDLGGIAKGYAATLVDELFEKYGYEFGYVSSGSSSMAVNKKYDKAKNIQNDFNYDLGIRKPRKGMEQEKSVFGSVSVSDILLSSSGDYENFFELDGKIYCHIIDPRTGYPMNALSSDSELIAAVTIIGDEGGYLDGISTAVCVMGKEKAIEFLENLRQDGIEYVLVTFSKNSDFYKVYSSYAEDKIKISDGAYILQ